MILIIVAVALGIYFIAHRTKGKEIGLGIVGEGIRYPTSEDRGRFINGSNIAGPVFKTNSVVGGPAGLSTGV